MRRDERRPIAINAVNSIEKQLRLHIWAARTFSALIERRTQVFRVQPPSMHEMKSATSLLGLSLGQNALEIVGSYLSKVKGTHTLSQVRGLAGSTLSL